MRTYDWRLTHTVRPETARKDIALIEIDEGSLRQARAASPAAGRGRAWCTRCSSITSRERRPRSSCTTSSLPQPTPAPVSSSARSTWSGARIGQGVRRLREGAGQRDLLDRRHLRRGRRQCRNGARRRISAARCLASTSARPSSRRSRFSPQAASGFGHNLLRSRSRWPACATWCHSSGRRIARYPSLGVAAALRAPVSIASTGTPRRHDAASAAIVRCLCRGDGSIVRRGRQKLSLDTGRFPRSGAARRSQESDLSDATAFVDLL